MASSVVCVFTRHGQSPARPHLWAGRSYWAPEGKRQSQVLPRVRGRAAAYLPEKIFNLRNSSGFDAFTPQSMYRELSDHSGIVSVSVAGVVDWISHSLQLSCVLICLHRLIRDKAHSHRSVPLSAVLSVKSFSTEWRFPVGEIEIASSKRVCLHPDGHQTLISTLWWRKQW